MAPTYKISDHDMFLFFLLSVLENKNSGPYLFFQRQFWSSVKVRVHRLSKRLRFRLTSYITFCRVFCCLLTP